MATDTAPGAEHILDEMKLYYEEVRDINARTFTWARYWALAALALATYTLFGLRSVFEDRFWTMVREHGEAVRAAAKVYAITGTLLTLGLFSVGCVSILQFGHSRRHKYRYWRSVSILRQKLHRVLGFLKPDQQRVIPLQTGLEEGPHKMFPAPVPRPFIKHEDFFIGCCLGAGNLIILVVPVSIFMGVWLYSNAGFQYAFGLYLGSAFANLSPLFAVLSLFNIKATTEYCRSLKVAQLVTDANPNPQLPPAHLARGSGRVLNGLLYSMLGLAVLLSLAAAFCSAEQLLFVRVCGALLLLLGTLVHRVARWALGQRSIGANIYQLAHWLVRPLGRARWEERASWLLKHVLRRTDEQITTWRQEWLDSRRRLRSSNVVRSPHEEVQVVAE